MEDKKLGRYLLLELKENRITLYKKWSKGECFESTNNFYESNDKELLKELFKKISTKNVYEIFKKLREKEDEK